MTALYAAVEKENTEIIKILLTYNDLNINVCCVFTSDLFMTFKNNYFNSVKIAFYGIRIEIFHEIKKTMF